MLDDEITRFKRALLLRPKVCVSVPRPAGRGIAARVVSFVLLVGGSALPATAQLSLARTHEGPLGYVTTGATLRTASNSSNACSVTTSATASLSGIPAGATIEAAYLYWAGSYKSNNPNRTNPDYTVRINNFSITADRTTTTTFVNSGTNYEFFGAFKDVTSRVSGNGNFTIDQLTVHSDEPHCSVQAVLGGWALFVVYRQASQPLRRIEVRDGLRAFQIATETVSLGNFLSAPTPDVKLTYLGWDGDPDVGGNILTPERVRFNGTDLSDGLNPANNPFNSTVSPGGANRYGIDLDTYDASSLLAAASRNATLALTASTDMFVLQAVVTSIAIVTVDVTPKGLVSPLSRLPGNGYSQVFAVENTSSASGSYDLIARAQPTSGLITIDSIRGTGITTQSRADSARITIPANTTRNYTVWYRIPTGPPLGGEAYLLARSVVYPTKSEARSEGWAELLRGAPQLTLVRSLNLVNPADPGTEVQHTLQFTNAGTYPATGVVIHDSVAPELMFKPGTVANALPVGITATVQYSMDGGATWNYTPVSGGCSAPAGFDACVQRIRWTLVGSLPANPALSSGTLTYTARVQ